MAPERGLGAKILDVAAGVILGGLVLGVLREGAYAMMAKDPVLGPEKRAMGALLILVGVMVGAAVVAGALLKSQ